MKEPGSWKRVASGRGCRRIRADHTRKRAIRTRGSARALIGARTSGRISWRVMALELHLPRASGFRAAHPRRMRKSFVPSHLRALRRRCPGTGRASAAAIALSALLSCTRTSERPPDEGTLQDLQIAFNTRQAALEKAGSELHERWLRAYVDRRPLPDDVKDAYVALVEVQTALEDWPAVLKTVDEFQAVVSDPGLTSLTLFEFDAALNCPGAIDRAVKIVQGLAARENPDESRLFDFRLRLHEALLDLDRVQEARRHLDAVASSPLLEGEEEAVAEVAQLRSDLAAIGTRPPDFSADTLDQTVLNLHALKGKVVLLDFWATWCAPCVAEFPDLVELYEQNDAGGFELIGVNVDEDEKRTRGLPTFVESRGARWPQIVDRDRGDDRLARRFGVKALPHTVLMDREGKIYRVGLRGERLARAVKGLIGRSTKSGAARG